MFPGSLWREESGVIQFPGEGPERKQGVSELEEKRLPESESFIGTLEKKDGGRKNRCIRQVDYF